MEEGSNPAPSSTGRGSSCSPQLSEEQPSCRLCWTCADAEEGGALVSPCSCSGSLKHIHERCLRDWQQALYAQGLGWRAQHCELCKAPYNAPQHLWRPSKQRLRPLHLLRAMQQSAVNAVLDGTWPLLLLRLWRAYVLACGAAHGVSLGLHGFKAGLLLGKRLVEEQSTMLASILSSLSNLLGSPLAELLWCQAVGALVVAMLSELVYTSVLGALGGAAVGFATGYVGAIRASVSLVSHGSRGLLVRVGVLAARSLRGLVRMLLRV